MATIKYRLVMRQPPLEKPYWFTQYLDKFGTWSLVSETLSFNKAEAEQLYERALAVGDVPEKFEVLRESP